LLARHLAVQRHFDRDRELRRDAALHPRFPDCGLGIAGLSRKLALIVAGKPDGSIQRATHFLGVMVVHCRYLSGSLPLRSRDLESYISMNSSSALLLYTLPSVVMC